MCFTSARRAYHILTFAIRAISPPPAICIRSPIQLIDLVHSQLHTCTTRRHARLGPAPFAWHSSRSSTFPTEQFGLCNLCLLVCPSFRDTPSHVFIATRSPDIILIPPHISIYYETILSVRASHILYLTSVLFPFVFYIFSLALISGCNSLYTLDRNTIHLPTIRIIVSVKCANI